MFTTLLKITSLTSVCVASFLLAGNVFAGPGNSRSTPASGTTASSHRQPIHFGQGGTTASSHRQPIHFGQGGTTASSHRQPIRFSHGYFYQGRDHNHWTRYTWSSRFGCYTYYCPITSCYYYWSEPTQCFYPVSYADIVTPTASTQLLNVNVNNNNNNTNTNVVTPNGPAPVTPAIPVRPIAGSTVGAELPPTE